MFRLEVASMNYEPIVGQLRRVTRFLAHLFQPCINRFLFSNDSAAHVFVAWKSS